MKTYDEMTNSLLERRDQYNAEQKRKKKNLTRTAVSAGCIALAVALGFGLQRSGLLTKKLPQNSEAPVMLTEYQPSSEPVQDEPSQDVTTPAIYQKDQTTVSPFQNDASNTAATNDAATTNGGDGEGKKLFAINEITEIGSCCPMDFSRYNKEVYSLQKAIEYLGVNIPQAVAECDDEAKLVYKNYNEFSIYSLDDGEIVWDEMCYCFCGDGDTRLDILTSKLYAPTDCVYHSNTNKPTAVGIPETGETVSLHVYHRIDKSFEKEYDFYIIDFEHGGIYYRIRSENVELIYLDSVVRSIVIHTDPNSKDATKTAYTEPPIITY